MDKVLSAIKCPNCHSFFESPVLLPCNHSVCKRHVLVGLNSQVKCGKCSRDHEIPKDGFVEIQALADIIDARVHSLDFWKIHDEAKVFSINLETLIAQISELLTDPDYYIHQEIDLLKNAILLKREELKLGVDNQTERLLREVELHLTKCREHLKVDECKNDIKEIEKMKSAAELKLNSWRVELDEFKQDEKSWTEVSNVIRNEKNRLADRFESLKKSLMLKSFRQLNKHTDFFRAFELNLIVQQE